MSKNGEPHGAPKHLLWVPLAAVVLFIAFSVWSAAQRQKEREPEKTPAETRPGGFPPETAHTPTESPPSPPPSEHEPSESAVSPEWMEVHERRFGWEKKFAAAQTPTEAFNLLEECFTRASEKADEDPASLRRIIALCEALSHKWPDSRQSVDAKKLVFRCHTELGEAEDARAAYLTYAEAYGQMAELQAVERGKDEATAKKEGTERTAGAIYGQGSRHFQKKEYEQSVFYFGTVLHRFPETKAADKSLYMLGRYHEAMRKPEPAMEAFKTVLERSTDTALLQAVIREVHMVAVNFKRKEEGLMLMDDVLKRFPDNKKLQGYVWFKTGLFQYFRGREFYPDAIRRLQKVVKDRPDSPYAQGSQQLITKMNEKMLEDLKPE